jgi:formylglycine-generating enzyme required for sulfatase activity
MKKKNLEEFLRRLPELHERLRENRMDCGPDTWVAVHELLLALARKGRLPDEPLALIPLLGPIVCNNPEQQRAFPALFEAWWSGHAQAGAALVSGAEIDAGRRVRRAADSVERTWGQAPYVLFLLLLFMLAGGLWWKIHGETPEAMEPAMPVAAPKPKIDNPPPGAITGKPKTPPIPVDDWAPPRRVGEWPVLPAAWTPWLEGLGLGLPWAPALPALAWLAARYRRRWALRKAHAEGDEGLKRLRVRPPQALFGGAQTAGPLRRLHAARRQITRRLDIAATVEATARQAGDFAPRFLGVNARPRYLVLVRSRGARDQGAALAEELVERFREQGLDVESFQFRDDPRRLHAQDRIGAPGPALAELARAWGDARLVVVGDGDILYHPLTGHPRPWLAELQAWERRVWLHPGPLPETLARWLWERGILALPLAAASLEALTQWLVAWRRPETPDAVPDEDPLPRPLTLMPERWLEFLPPEGEDLDALFASLQGYLGADGWRLLQAVAAYPEPHWPLTQALDFCLFEPDASARRERRLRRLGRLVWIRHGHLPDYLRERLLEQLAAQARQSVRDAYARLLLPDGAGGGPGVLRLDIAAPSRRRLRRFLLDLLWPKPDPSRLDDPIFLDLVLGERLSLLDFHLPRALARFLPGARRRLNPWPALAALSLSLMAAWGIHRAWDRWGEESVGRARAGILRAEKLRFAPDGENRWRVDLAAAPEAFVLGQAVAQTLQAAGYKVNPPGPEILFLLDFILASPEARDAVAVRSLTGEAAPDNVLRYPRQAEAEARRLADHLAHAAYGAAPRLEAADDLPGGRMELRLVQAYRPGSVFRDRLVNAGAAELAASVEGRAVFTLFRDALPPPERPAESGKPAADAKPRSGPEMLVLPGGSFVMGCIDKTADKYCYPDEFPAHRVTVQPFAMGRHEVTFEDYDAYVEAASLDKTRIPQGCAAPEKPDDGGWGRGRRPVIHVNWKRAGCYAAWLSRQTGQNYRLPSEAEWEYAARAGTETPWHWGGEETAAKDYAWFGNNSAGQTRPSGGKRPNAFGLHDMSGNVWEWTADCWHDSYEGAPQDGAAWGEENGGDCARRVVRGGSWNGSPQNLRSSGRIRYGSDAAYVNLGFRLARGLF